MRTLNFELRNRDILMGATRPLSSYLLLAVCSFSALAWAGRPTVEDSGVRGDKSHWAYKQIVRPAVPIVLGDSRRDFVRNAIDSFLLAKLSEQKLQPAPEADRRTLARRLYFDLLGLPPSPAVVEEFLSDPADDAYERLLDRVLASPHFGERMAMYWLDLVRYGDTNGYHADVHRNVFPYRDYVIRAFNANKPFDQFTIEQLAGDLLPGATLEQRVASGYNRMNMITTEGGAQAKEYLAKYAADRVRNASTVWMASTLGCAECHDHKFDPFTTRDFYSFAAFFADVKQVGVYPNQVDLDPQLKVPTSAQVTELERLDARIASLQLTVDKQTPELDAAQAEWERSLETARVAWSVLHPVQVDSAHGSTFALQDDGSILAMGESPDTDTYTLTFASDLKAITALRIDVLPDDSLPGKGPGRASNGNFVVSHLTLDTIVRESDELHAVSLQNASASFEQKGGNLSVASAIDATKKDGKPGWAISDQFGRPHHAVFETKEDLGDGSAITLRLSLHQTHGDRHTIGRFRVSATSSPRPVSASATKFRGVPDSVANIVLTQPGDRSDEQKNVLAAHFRSIAPLLEPVRAELNASRKTRDELDKSIPRTLHTVAVEPQVMHILPRGNWLDESGEIVQPSVPGFLAPTGAAGTVSSGASCISRTEDQLEAANLATSPDRLTRLDLARWLVSRDNPLTARVFVNRLWMRLFGQGLVRSTEDFGAQGSPPTHPELLDWLAREFIDSGWDVKYMIRLIALSGTYRQSSQAAPDLRRVDPYNQWLARQGRFRFDGEMVRDNALAISGLLTPKLGGRSVKPYQPEGYWDHCNTFQGKLVYDQDHGEDLYRRGLYSYWKRTFLHPSLLAFDAPSREECTAERPRSNTPLQALVLLNDPTYVEAARVFAERIIRDGGARNDDRIQFAYHRALARPATANESKVLRDILQHHFDQYRSDNNAANELIHIGESPVPEDIEPAELAAWTSAARVILNLHEAITRY